MPVRFGCRIRTPVDRQARFYQPLEHLLIQPERCRGKKRSLMKWVDLNKRCPRAVQQSRHFMVSEGDRKAQVLSVRLNPVLEDGGDDPR